MISLEPKNVRVTVTVKPQRVWEPCSVNMSKNEYIDFFGNLDYVTEAKINIKISVDSSFIVGIYF